MGYVHLGEGGTPTSGVGVAVEPGRGVAVGPGGGGGVACRKEPVLSVPLAGTFASSCAAKVLDAVEDEVGVAWLPRGRHRGPGVPARARSLGSASSRTSPYAG